MLKLQSSLKAACTAVAALAVSGCSQDELVNQPTQKGNTTIVASFEGAGPGTRTSVKEENGAVNVVWNEGDEFGLFYTSDTHTTTATAKFTYSVGGTSVTEATFNGKLEGNNPVTSYAVYPHGLITNFSDQSDKIVTMALPETFNYTEASNGPMYAIATDIENKIEFKHLAGLLKLTVSSEAENATSFIITADKPIAGSFNAKLNAANPKLEAVDANQSKTITVDISDKAKANFSNNKTVTFYIPIPVGTYSTLSAQLGGNDEVLQQYKPKEWTNVTVGRKQMLTATFGFVKVEAGSGLNNAIAEALPKQEPEAPVTANLAVEGTIDATQNGTIEIPVYKNSNVNLILNEAPSTNDSKPLELKDKDNSTDTSGEALNAVTIAIPPAANQGDGHYLTVEMPKTTVELDVADGNTGTTTVYKKIVATTASNTLVIKKGVKVEALEVKGGNVRVAGEITSITNSSGSNITLYKETGAIVTTVGDNIEVVEDNNLMDAAKNGGKCTLKSNVFLSEPLVVEGNMTLDLAGYSIKSLNDESLKKVLNTSDALILVRRGASLTIDDSSTGKTGSIDGSSVASIYAAVKLTDKEDGGTGTDATLIVNGGTLKGYTTGISGNGLRHGTSITINDGIIGTNDNGVTGIYHPQDGTLTVNGGTITGPKTGIEIRSGKLVITNGIIKHTATQFEEAANGNGQTVTGAAVAVSQHVTDKELSVTISGGELQGGTLYALYEKDLQNNQVGNITMKVTDGKLAGEVFSENCKDFIEGGGFNDFSAMNYLVDNKDVTVTLDSDVNIIGKSVLVPAGKKATLDLNGHTITAANKAGDNIAVLGKLTLQDSGTNGKIVASEDYSSEYNKTLINIEGENASMTMQGGYINAAHPSNPANNGQFGVGLFEGADFTMTGGKIEAGWYAVSGNGNYKTQNSIINISGGELISTADYALYLPQAGTTTISGDVIITGACGGIGMRNGSLEISGTPQITSKGTGSTGDWKDGTGNTGNAVISVGSGNPNTYGNCTVTINGGTFTAEGNATVIDKQANPKHTIAININGGTFSDPTALAYLTDNANVNVNFNKDNEITALYIPKGQTVTMDLNQKKLTVKADEVPATIDVEGKTKKNINVLVSGSLTLKNGSVENNKKGMALTASNAKLELDGITYTTNHVDHNGIFNDPNVEGSSITVKNNSSITGVYYGISTNALDNPVGSTTITLENSTFTAKETALMVNIPSTVTVTNCTFNGGWQGVFLRGGTATFANSRINLVFANDYATSSIAQGSTWKSGNQAPAAALTAGNRSDGAYDYKTKITLSNTTFSNSGTDKNSKVATDYPAIYIDTESVSSKPNQGVELTYDEASKTSCNAAGTGLVIGNKDNVKVNGSTPDKQ